MPNALPVTGVTEASQLDLLIDSLRNWVEITQTNCRAQMRVRGNSEHDRDLAEKYDGQVRAYRHALDLAVAARSVLVMEQPRYADLLQPVPSGRVSDTGLFADGY